jgi:TIR domain
VDGDWITDTSRKHAFISYVREDEVRAEKLQSALEAAGVEVWRDKDNLAPGSDWAAEIRKAITVSSLAFIPCFSRESHKRDQSFQYDELISAIGQFRKLPPNKQWLFPVRFEPVILPELSLGAGRTLSSLQSADLFGPHRDRNLVKLTRAVANLVAK